MRTFATLFSGGGGVDVGLMAAGLSPVWAVEYDADIAAVYADNIGHAPIVADVRAVDYSALQRVDWLHASPSCVRASNANVNAGEAQEDIEAAQAVMRALVAVSPDVFTLENVWQYRTFAAFRLICDALGYMGYFWTYDHVNAADFGVPQTRRRLILRASRGLLPLLPAPVPWVGWYAAIADLLPTLPESKLAPWQVARLPADLRGTMLINDTNAGRDMTVCQPQDPVFTITSQLHKGMGRACLDARVVAMTPRALARFQSVPDWYRLPEKRSLAARVIGNMVPPLVMQRIAEGVSA